MIRTPAKKITASVKASMDGDAYNVRSLPLSRTPFHG
jgi:hypothetical protein